MPGISAAAEVTRKCDSDEIDSNKRVQRRNKSWWSHLIPFADISYAFVREKDPLRPWERGGERSSCKSSALAPL